MCAEIRANISSFGCREHDHGLHPHKSVTFYAPSGCVYVAIAGDETTSHCSRKRVAADNQRSKIDQTSITLTNSCMRRLVDAGVACSGNSTSTDSVGPRLISAEIGKLLRGAARGQRSELLEPR